MSDYSPQQSEDLTLRQQFNLGAAFAAVWACSIDVFLHEHPGRRYPGLLAAGVPILVMFYCLAWRGYDLTIMLLFLLAFLAFCVAHRLDSALPGRSALREHSRYTGTPRLMLHFPGVSEVTVKTWIEPAIVMVAGSLTAWAADPPLGWYLILGGLCQRISGGLALLNDQHRVMDLNDAVLEQELLSRQFRELRDQD